MTVKMILMMMSRMKNSSKDCINRYTWLEIVSPILKNDKKIPLY